MPLSEFWFILQDEFTDWRKVKYYPVNIETEAEVERDESSTEAENLCSGGVAGRARSEIPT